MSTPIKPVESLRVADFKKHPVWQFVNNDEIGETAVRALKRIPVKNLSGSVVGTQVVLANGSRVWGVMSNVESEDPRSTQHFLFLSVLRNGKQHFLARYHDFNYESNGPDSLAEFLGLGVDEVFPISYDLTPYSQGDPLALRGKILKKPRERLTQKKLIAMAVSSSAS